MITIPKLTIFGEMFPESTLWRGHHFTFLQITVHCEEVRAVLLILEVATSKDSCITCRIFPPFLLVPATNKPGQNNSD